MGVRHDDSDTSRIREFFRMNPPRFTGSITTEDPENFVDELKKVFYKMHVIDAEQIDLDAYQLKSVVRLGSISGMRVEMRMHHIPIGSVLKKPSWGISFPEN